MSGQRGDTGTRTPAWMDKVDEFQNFSVPRSAVIVPSSFCLFLFFCFFVCVCVRERERECVYVCVCMRERERKRERERDVI